MKGFQKSLFRIILERNTYKITLIHPWLESAITYVYGLHDMSDGLHISTPSPTGLDQFFFFFCFYHTHLATHQVMLLMNDDNLVNSWCEISRKEHMALWLHDIGMQLVAI